ncbi:MAG: acylneuraminate cytidylyltransferase [Candidatus Electrothrix aestuarii]|uniref:Acylneuraminate cytidylyltransferase n=1 Tax=Candidatus Electrothrix aestuarii TaxID=3062594 RepID=A0AAU8LWX8_9BACT|nr:hypothetical protein [Candidatus Electrothrix aestuarii]
MEDERRVIAIIPARGGSVGIPRKNVRLMGKKPLLAYSIENCLAAEEIDDVFVSTEDAEIAEVARRFGAKVLERPLHLADAITTLDEVILNSVKQLEEKKEYFSFVVTVQATAPLMKPENIDKAIRKCVLEGLDTVLTVVENTHLTWTGSPDGGDMFPAYAQRVNRQQLPPSYKETGGVVVCPRDVLLSTTSRFGQHVGVIEISKKEAIDIDDYFDWWLIEKSLQRKRICFHVIGNRLCGLGHVYRALTLADRLVDHDIWFLVNDESQMAQQIIQDRFYEVVTVAPGKEVQTLLSDGSDLIINDILDTEDSFMRALTEAGVVSVNFEDLGTGASKATYVINSMYDAPAGQVPSNVLSGIDYCCLRDEFYSVFPRESTSTKDVRNILLLFGGTDPAGLTLKILHWLDQIEGDWEVTVILGIGFVHEDEVVSFAGQANHHIEIVRKTKIISRYMSEADIAITSAGRTVYELGSLGIPVLSVAANEREMTHDFVRKSPGVIFLGAASELTETRFNRILGQVVYSDILRSKMTQHLLESGIRNGIDNVLNIIDKALRVIPGSDS